MINNTYDYSDLKDQVKAELKQAITEGGKEALVEGLAEVMSQKLEAKKIKFDTSELTKYIEDQITNALNNVKVNPKDIKGIQGIDLKSLIGLDDKALKSKIKELDNILAETAKKTDAKQLLGGLLVAKGRGIDISDIYDIEGFNEFVKEYKFNADLIKSVNEEIAKSSPKNVAFLDAFVESVGELDQLKGKVSDFIGLYKGLLDFMKSSDSAKPKDYWDDLIKNYDKLDKKTKELISSLGELKRINDGANNQGGLVGDDQVIMARKITDQTSVENTKELKSSLDELVQSGVQVANILDVIHDKESDLFLEVQQTAKGSPISSIGGEIEKINPDVFKATDEQIVKLINDLKKIYDSGLEADVENLSNVFYDLQKGFTLIDLDVRKEGNQFGFASFEEMFEAFVQTLRYNVEDINDILGSEIDSQNFEKFTDRVEKIGEQMAKAAKEGYAKGQDSNSPSKDFEKLEKDAVAGIQKGADESEENLKQTGAQMAKNVKKGFEEELAKKEDIDFSEEFDDEELEEYKNVLEDVSDIIKVLSSEPKDSKNYEKNKEGLDDLKDDYYEIIDLIKMLESGSSLDEVFASDKWKEFAASISEVGDFEKTVEDILDEQDALDENLQRQKHITEEKKETLQAQEEINKAEIESPDIFEEKSGQLAYVEGLDEIKTKEEELREEAKKTDDVIEGQLSLFDSDKIESSIDEIDISGILNKKAIEAKRAFTDLETKLGREKLVSDLASGKTNMSDVLEDIRKFKEEFLETEGIDLSEYSFFNEASIKDKLEQAVREQKQLTKQKKETLQAQEEINKAESESPSIYEEKSGQLSYVEGLEEVKAKEEELQQETKETNDVIEGQLSLFDSLKESDQGFVKDEDIQNAEKETEITSELYDKLVRIQDLTNNFSIFEPEDIDESSLKEFQQTLFALSETDLKNLGIDDVDSLIEDLKAVEERISEIKWQFENNTYDDESFVENDQLFDFIDKTGELEEVGRQITDTYDESGIAVQRLIDLISGIDTSNFRDQLDETLEKQEQITKEKKEATQVQEQINNKDEEENNKKTQSINLMAEAVKKKQQEKESTESVVKAKKEEATVEEEIVEEKKKSLDVTESIATAEKTAGETQLSAYKQALITLKELTEQQEYYRNLLEKTPPQYAIEKYDNRRNAYSKLSDDDLNAKLIEKASEPLESNTTKLKKQISSILALIDEFKARGQEINFEDVVPKGTDLSAIDKIVDSLRNYFKLLNDNSGKDYKSEWQSEIQTISQQRDALERQLKSLADQDPLDRLEYRLKQIINGEIPLMANEVHEVILRTMNDIYELTGKMPKIEDYTDKSRIIKGVNNELQRRNLLSDENVRAERQAKYEAMMKAKADEKAAKATKEESAAIKEETAAIKEETAAIEENINVQKGNVAAENITTPTPVTMPAPINNGFVEEGGVVSTVVGSEIKSLEELKLKVLEIRDAIDQKTSKFEEERRTVDAVVESERTSLNLLRDKLAELKGYISELYNQLGQLKAVDFSNKVKVEGLSTLVNSLKDDKINDKLTAMYTYLDDFAKAVNKIDFKNNLIDQLNIILSKSEELKNLATVLKKVNNANVQTVKNKIDDTEVKNVKEYNDAYQLLIKTEERYQELSNKKNGGSLLSEREAKELSKITSDRKQAEKTIGEIVKKTNGEILKQSNAEKQYTAQVEKTTEALKAGAEAREKLEASNNRNSLVESLQKEIDGLNKIEFAPKFVKEFSKQIHSEIENAKKALKGTDDQIEYMVKHLREFKDNIPKNALQSSYTALNKDALDISETLSKNSKMSSKLKRELLSLYDTINRFKNTGIFEDEDLVKVKNRIIEIKDEINKTGQTGKSIIDKFKVQLSHFWAQQLARYFSFYDIVRYVKTSVNAIRELDTALIDLRKTTTMTAEELNEFYYAASGVAQGVGVTTKDIISQAAAWSRLGYSSKEAATEMAELSSQFAQISPGMDVETATDGLVSSMKAFGFEVDEVERNVMDNINRIGNTMATTNEEIVQMLERSSAAMSAANNTIEQTIALESAAVQVTRNAETTGTAFRTISMRIRGYDEETEEKLEDYEELKGKIADLTKTAKTPGGISLFSDKDKTTFKSTYQLLKDISEIWDELTDKEQAQLTEKLAGKRGGQVLSAIMNDFSEVERAMTEMSQAAGSSDKEMEIIEQSIDYKINAIKQSWVGFLQDVLKREDLGKLFDALLKGSESLQKTLSTLTPVIVPLVEALAKLIDMFAELNESTNGLAGVAALVFGGFRVKSKFDGVRGIFSSLLGGANISAEAAPFTKKFTDFFTKELPLETASAISKSDAGNLLSEALLTQRDFGTEAAEAFARREAQMSLKELDALAKGTPKTTTAFKNLFKVTADGTGKFGAFAANLGMSSAALAGWIAVAVAAAVATYKLVTAQDEINKQIKEAYDNYAKTTESLNDYQDRIKELRSITDDSTKSIEEQQAAREELLSIQSEMIDQFGVEAGKIDILKDSVDSLNNSFEVLNNKSYQEFINNVNRNEGWQGFWNNASNFFNGYGDNFESMKDQMENYDFSFKTNFTLGSDAAKKFKEEFEKRGINIDLVTEGNGAQLTAKGTDQNLKRYYDTLLDIQNEYRDKTDETSKQISDILGDEANDVNDILGKIGDSYQTYLQQEVIFPKYGEQVNELRTIMSQLHQAQISDNQEEVDKFSKQLTEAYESIYNNGELDESSKIWFENLVKEYQGIIDRQEFIMKIKPKIETEESKDYKTLINQLKDSGLSRDEIKSKLDIAKETDSDAVLKSYGWDEKLIAMIRHLQRILDENPISVDFIFDEEKISNLPGEVMKLIGDAYEKLSDEDKAIVDTFSEKQIKDEISCVKSEYRKMLADLSKEGNVDLTIRPVVDSSTMQAAGWDVEDGEIATTFKSGKFVWQGDEETGQYVYIHYTPILPDGTVLSPEEVDDYINNTLQHSQNVLDADEKGLVIKVDTDINIPEDEIKDFQEGTGKASQNVQDFINKADKWDDKVHKVEEAFYDVNGEMGFAEKALDNLIRKTKQLEDETEEVSFSDTIDSLSDLEKQLDTVDKAFAELFDKDDMQVDLSSVKAIKDAFKEIDENFDFTTIEDELNDLLSAASPEEAQNAVDGLVSKFIEESKILETVNEKNKDLIQTQLELMGVENAEEIVLAALEGRKDAIAAENQFLEQTGRDVTAATYDEITAFLQENEVSESTRQHLAQLALEKISVNENKIKTDDDCQQLLNLANAAMASETAIAKIKELKAILSDSRAGSTRVEWAQQQLNAINNGTFDWGFEKNKIKVDDIQVPKAHYTGGKATKAAQKAAEKSGKETAETFDWIETKIQRCEEEIQRLDKTVSATYKGWSKRNGAITSELDKIREKIALQSSAYQAYMAKANSIGLSEHYKNLVKNGAIKIEDVADENLKKMINDFKTFYEKAIAAKDAIEDLNAQLAQLAKQKFDNVKAEFEGFTSEIEHFTSLIDKQLSHVENMGKIAGKSFYNAKMEQDTQKINDLYKEREVLMQSLREAEANGIEAGSADWIAMRDDIYAVDEAIADLTYELEDLKKKLKEVAKLNFDNLKEQFENALSILNNQKGLTDAVVSMVETSGHIASRAYYESLIEGSKATVTGLRKQYETLTKALADAVASGDIEEYSEEWYEMQNDIASVKNELVDAANATIEYVNALRQINWDVFDRGVDAISKLIDETEFFIELLSYEDLFDKETGDWTDEGITTRGLMVEKYQAYMDAANAYGEEAEEIRKLLETDPKNTTLIDRYYELLEAQRQAIINSKKEKKAVQDLYKEAYDNLLKRIKKLIDEYKRALQASKDLYDYENTIQEKTKNINDIRKQLLAYGSGYDTSEENRATIQKLNTDLDAAQKDLEQTEYDKYIQDQQNLLDQFYNELQEWIDGRLDNIEALFEEAIEATNLNGLLIDNTLHENADAVNYQMTEEFMSIWDKYADGEGYAALSYDILGLTNDVTNGIRDKMEELPTDANLSQYFDGVDLAILEQIASEENNANNMTNAINMTNEGINRISSNIVELSNTLGSKIDYAGSSVANAINSLDFSTGSSGYDAPGGGNYDGGGDGGGGNTNPSNDNPSNPGRASNGNQYTVYQTRSTNGQSMNEQKGTFSTAGEANAYKRKLESTYRNTGASFVVRMYAKGGLVGKNKNILDSIAQLFGEDHMIAAKEGERVLTEDQTKNFEKMVNANFTPLDADAKDKYSMLSGLAGKDISSSLANIPTPEIGNLTNVGNTTTVGDVSITLPNVTNKEEFVEWLKNDGQIERIIQSMTIGRLNGGNSYAKLRF